MNIFDFLYKKIISWSRMPNADRYLFALSFSESSFFPIPPDVMLIPMCLANRSKIWYLAGITTISSVLGGVLGYLLGYLVFDLIEAWLLNSDYWSSYETARLWFDKWGLFAVLLAGFSPIPYKIFTIAAGITGVNIFGFILFSILGRGARFFLIAALIYVGGDAFKHIIEKYINILGWFIVVIVLIFFLLRVNDKVTL